VPAVAVETAHRTLRDVLAWTIPSLDPRLRTVDATRLATSHAALEEVRAFIAAVLSEPESAPTHARHVAAIHAVDHLEQLVTLAEAPARVTAAAVEALGDLRAVAGEVIDIAAAAAQDGGGPAGATAGEAAERLVRSAREARERVIAEAASGRVAAPEALRRLDALRWMEAFAHHVHRALHHLGTVDGDAAPAPVAPGH
jgi:phosphate:Na+ symporter